MRRSESSVRGQPRRANEAHMSPKRKLVDDDMRPEYDFTGGVRGKYFERYQQGTNVVLLDPDVAAVFKDPVSVNDALRALLAVAEARVAAVKREIGGTRPQKPRSTTASKEGRGRAARG